MKSEAELEVEIQNAVQQWIAAGSTSALPLWLYDSLVTRDPLVFEEMRRRGVLQILPLVEGRQQNDPVTLLQQTPLGSLPPSLVGHVGIAGDVFSGIIAHLVPYCEKCASVAEPPGSLEDIELPGQGVVAVSVVDDDYGASLRERCEWLGSERAIVHGRLERVEALSDDIGEPVVSVVPTDKRDQLQSDVSRWFNRGGGALRLVHFSSRDAMGLALGKLSAGWSCRSCNRSFSSSFRTELESAPPCATCRGSGWIADSTARLIACRECHGFGLMTEVSRYYFSSVPLHRVAQLTFAELLATNCFSGRTQEAIQTVIDCGFGSYPIAAPLYLLSPGERCLLAVLSGKLSGFRDVQYLVDGAVLDAQTCVLISKSSAAQIIVAKPEVASKVFPSASSHGGDVVLRDIRRGCLEVAEIRIPIGGFTVVEGPAGSGKSVLASILVERFTKRRKLAPQVSFGDLKRCTVVQGDVAPEQTVLEVLELEVEFASEIARTRRAQELGILRDDLILSRTRYRCEACGGQEGEDGVCSRCLGALYDWRVSELPVAGRTVAELLVTPLSKLIDVPWVHEAIAHRIATMPGLLRERVSLGTRLRKLSQSERRFLAVWSGLARVVGYAVEEQGGKKGPALSRDLVVVDGPRCMPTVHSEVLGEMLSTINRLGATVVCASKPEGLEFAGSYVLHLGDCGVSSKQRDEREGYLDTRYARVCGKVM